MLDQLFGVSDLAFAPLRDCFIECRKTLREQFGCLRFARVEFILAAGQFSRIFARMLVKLVFKALRLLLELLDALGR